MRPRLFFHFPAVFLFFATMLQAALITSPGQLPASSVTITFNRAAPLHTTGPIQVGSQGGVTVTLTSTNPDGSLLGPGPYDLADNGVLDATTGLAGLDVDLVGGDQYSMTFNFTGGAVSAIGGRLNYSTFPGSGFSDVFLTALGSDRSILESYDITQLAPISTPGAVNASAFRGILRSKPDIAAFVVSNSAAVLQDLSFAPVPLTTPEPGSLLLLITGAAVLSLFSRGSKRLRTTHSSP